MSVPKQREVWLSRLDPTEGHEQAGTRPVVVLSREALNSAGWGLCICVPLTTRDRGSPLHVEVAPPEGGLRHRSFALTDQVRALNRTRLKKRLGEVKPETHARIASLLARAIAPEAKKGQ